MGRSLLFNVLLLSASMAVLFNGYAQQHLYESDLGQVSKPGFYQVSLHPSIISRCRQDLGDIRIFDRQARQVPYILKKPAGVNRKEYYLLASPDVSIRDSLSETYIHITLKEESLVDELELTIRAPKFYRRKISVRKLSGHHLSYLSSLTIRSGQQTRIPLGFNVKELIVAIENDDNPPLDIQSVQLWQLNQYLLAYLEPGMHYHLAFGDSITSAPRYDLEFFKDSIGKLSGRVLPGPVVKMARAAPVKEQQVVKKENGLLLWIIISAVLLLLLGVTFRLTREMKNRGT
jgi:hypothetical protein